MALKQLVPIDDFIRICLGVGFSEDATITFTAICYTTTELNVNYSQTETVDHADITRVHFVGPCALPIGRLAGIKREQAKNPLEAVAISYEMSKEGTLWTLWDAYNDETYLDNVPLISLRVHTLLNEMRNHGANLTGT